MSDNLHIAWARLLVRGLAAGGVTDVVVSPGSRSTPLVLAAVEHGKVRCHRSIDERAAAFLALGQARVTGRPTALVCTSGTAPAHYHPAVIEASESRTPLVVLSADRPWELHGSGAPQAVDQVKLFGDRVRAHFALGAPSPGAAALRNVVRVGVQACVSATHPVPGPVHVNVPFREPLEPQPEGDAPAWRPTFEALATAEPAAVHLPETTPDPAAVAGIAERIRHAERGLIVCGPAPAHGDLNARRAAVARLAALTGFPVWAEATSQLRFGPFEDGARRLSALDALWRGAEMRDAYAPDLIMQLGAVPTSKTFARWIGEGRGCTRIVASSWLWEDPHATAEEHVVAEPRAFADALSDSLAAAGVTGPGDAVRAWSERLGTADAAAFEGIRNAMSEDGLRSVTSEGRVAAAVAGAAPRDSTLVVGNSMPIRDLDTFCAPSNRALTVVHQRGANGVDGLIATAAGAASATDGPVTALLGDVSAVHDLTSLTLARDVRGPLVLVVVNNRGGRIFEQLPIAANPALGAEVERYFAMPPDVDFGNAAAAFGVRFERARSQLTLMRVLGEAYDRDGATLLEAVVTERDTRAAYAALWETVAEAVRGT